MLYGVENTLNGYMSVQGNCSLYVSGYRSSGKMWTGGRCGREVRMGGGMGAGMGAGMGRGQGGITGS